MESKSIQFVVAVLAGLMLSVSAASAADHRPTTKELWISGHAYEAHLKASQVNDIAGSGRDLHYRGHFPEDPDSWVRVSRLADGWEGLAFVFSRLHTIRGGNGGDQIASYSFSHQESPQCGLDHMHADASITPDSLASMAMAQAVTDNYGTLCADRVDGACLMLELELAFDLQFQNRFSNYQSRAGAILNMVEGFYQAQFGIVFDTLSLTFMDTELFSTTRDAGALLGDVASKRANRQIPFLQSERSIFHFISGRDFNGGTAGVAYVGSVCNGSGFASGVTNALNSNSTTAVVVAHEIGHNLGSSHDGTGSNENGCPVSGKIMSPSVNGSAAEFSSCSVALITDRISALSDVGQCFNFPADIGIEALTSNPLEVTQGEIFQAGFDVVYRDAAQPADRIAVEGSVGNNEGRLEQVTLNGAACTLTSETEFRCAETQARSNLRLAVQATAGASATINLVQGVGLISNSGEVKDIDAGNDTLVSQIAIAEAETAPVPDEPMLPDTPPRDAGGEAKSSNASSGGGGGSVGWFWLLAGLAGAGRLATRAG